MPDFEALIRHQQDQQPTTNKRLKVVDKTDFDNAKSEKLTTTKSGLLVPAGSEKTSEALPLIDVDSGNQFWAVASGAWKFIWPPTGKVVLAVRESQIIAEEEISNKSDSGQLPIMK